MIKKLYLSWVKIKFHILKIMKMKMNFIKISMIMDYQCLKINYLLNNWLK
jgi:hypothetical protein